MDLVIEHSGDRHSLKIASLTKRILEEDLGHNVDQAIGDGDQVILYDEDLNEISRFSGVPTRDTLRLMIILNCSDCEDSLD